MNIVKFNYSTMFATDQNGKSGDHSFVAKQFKNIGKFAYSLPEKRYHGYNSNTFNLHHV